MTNKEIREYEDLRKSLFEDVNILRFLELYIIDRMENMETLRAVGRDSETERIKLEGVAELRKELSERSENENE
ncbi:hypothetical protein [Faecalimonas sp.]